ncbi:MAG: ABC transporter ATP-binding protein [Candidatus Omnitrophica bacterium]|nr:ABC transporter ATP-binding protein [Candidatus Omnitrophota bacterium]
MSIRLENISKVFQAPHKQISVFKNINLEIKDKEMLVIFGPSGIGKTTLLNLIGGMDKPTSGRVIIDGIDLSILKSDELAKLRKERIGFIFQTFNLLANLKAMDNITLPILLDKDIRDKIDRINEFAAEIGIEQRLDHRPQELSLGQQQRVAIMRAMINSPAIILADEPTADLDNENSSKIIEIFKNLNKKHGTTIILATDHEAMASEFDHRFTLSH